MWRDETLRFLGEAQAVGPQHPGLTSLILGQGGTPGVNTSEDRTRGQSDRRLKAPSKAHKTGSDLVKFRNVREN